MDLHDLLAWIQRGNGIKGIPKIDVDKCPHGLIINITDMDEKQVSKLVLSLMPKYANVPIVKIGIPKAKVISVPKKVIKATNSQKVTTPKMPEKKSAKKTK